MGLINWIFDIYQHTRIEKLRNEVAMNAARGGGVDTQRLESALGELALAVKTVQRLAVQKGLCTHDEFVRMLETVDREDGRQDGQSPVR